MRPADGESAAEDFRDVPLPGRSDGLLSDSQLRVHDAQARPGAAARAQRRLSGSAFPSGLGLLSSYPILRTLRVLKIGHIMNRKNQNLREPCGDSQLQYMHKIFVVLLVREEVRCQSRNPISVPSAW